MRDRNFATEELFSIRGILDNHGKVHSGIIKKDKLKQLSAEQKLVLLTHLNGCKEAIERDLK